ncbi:MAG: alpha/beta hydrolase [Spirochaetota bacterium]
MSAQKMQQEQFETFTEEFELKLEDSYLKFKKIEAYPGRPFIVFLHDSLGCIALWKQFPETLAMAHRCNVLLYDRMGYGGSTAFVYQNRDINYLEQEADTLQKILQVLKIKKLILYGHSDGGSIALLAAAKYPDLVEAIISEGAHVFVEECTLQGIKYMQNVYETSNLKRVLQKYHGDKTETVFQMWANTWLSSRYRSWNIEHFLPRITCPVFVMQGEMDEYGTEAQVGAIANQVLGKSVKFVVPKAKHSPHKETPKLVLQKVGQWIEQVLVT